MARRLSFSMDSKAFQPNHPQAPVVKNWASLVADPEAARNLMMNRVDSMFHQRDPKATSVLRYFFSASEPTLTGLMPTMQITNLAARLFPLDHRYTFVKMVEAAEFANEISSRKTPSFELMVIDGNGYPKLDGFCEFSKLPAMSMMDFVQALNTNPAIQLWSILQATHYLWPESKPVDADLGAVLSPAGFYMLMNWLRVELRSIE